MKTLLGLISRVHTDDYSLTGAIQEIIATTASKNRHAEYTPYHKLPDVRSVRVEVSAIDELFAKFNITKRKTGAKLHYVKYKNQHLNRYMLWTIRRMRKASDQVFWTMANHIVKRSRVFFLVALKHVDNKWHRDMPFYQVIKLYKDYCKIAKAMGSKPIDYKRVYIKKNNGKWRGLGVPTKVWRVYLHQINQLLVLRLDEKVNENQHGFRPGKGTLTAWLELLSKVDKYDNIVEFDYKGFFPNLDIEYIMQVLTKYGVPEMWRNALFHLNLSQPKLPAMENLEMNEVDVYKSSILQAYQRLIQKEMPDKPFPNPNHLAYDNQKYDEVLLHSAAQDSHSLERAIQSAEIAIEYAYWTINLLQKAPESDTEYLIDKIRYCLGYTKAILKSSQHPYIGLPQGAPTSPFLSILALDYLLKEEKSTEDEVRYADDGLKMRNQEIELKQSEEMNQANVVYEMSKSGDIKKEGIWKKELKFLGLIYNGVTKQLRADTRDGKSKLIFDKEDLITALSKREHLASGTSPPPSKDAKFSWDKFVQSSVAGFIFSRLYIGSWNLEEYVQNFNLSYCKGSWVEHYHKWCAIQNRYSILKGLLQPSVERLTVFNSSSLCLISALEALKESAQNNYKLKSRKIAVAGRFEEIQYIEKANKRDLENQSKVHRTVGVIRSFWRDLRTEYSK